MLELNTELLFTLNLQVETPLQMIGKTPYGERRIAKVLGGEFQGAKLKGTALPGGGDWLLLRNDGVLQLDVRLILKTADDALIYMTYKGLRHGPAAVMERLNRGDKVDPSEYYFRITPAFETGAEQYAWLNRIIAVGVGHRQASGPTYYVYQVV